MKDVKDIELATCSVCGEEYDKEKMRKLFTGRVRYICPRCHANGNKQIEAKHSEWRDSAKGKQIIAWADKKK